MRRPPMASDRVEQRVSACATIYLAPNEVGVDDRKSTEALTAERDKACPEQ
jgi:hypothetical protein